MYTTPETRFARAGGSTIAYQVYGDGPVTICTVPPMAQNIELAWDSPVIRRMLDAYASFSRQIVFDKRGTGMSDRSLDIPALDERIDELTAVLDAAGVERSFLHGVSEGGPMAIMFAATYPDRVEGLILEGTGASLITDEQRADLDRRKDAAMSDRQRAFIDGWGTPESMTVSLFGPSLASDQEFVEWWPRYERQAASRDALLQLFRLNGDMDARDVLHRVECPVLILHRTDDAIVPVERARETARQLEDVGADVRLVEHAGRDHWTFAGDVDAIVAEIERFTTGTVRPRPARRRTRAKISTMGRFVVEVDGEPVPTSAWGSKRARTLLKRLVVARGWPVTRDELFELLWPGDTSDRLGARLSVQLSAVRRILGGGVIADRSAIRLDVKTVDIDLEAWFALDDDAAIVDTYTGELFPDDRYEDWAAPLRAEVRDRFVGAAHRLVAGGLLGPDESISLLRRLVEADPYDEAAQLGLVRRLHAAGRHGEASTAHARYVEAMAELDVPPTEWDDVIGT